MKQTAAPRRLYCREKNEGGMLQARPDSMQFVGPFLPFTGNFCGSVIQINDSFFQCYSQSVPHFCAEEISLVKIYLYISTKNNNLTTANTSQNLYLSRHPVTHALRADVQKLTACEAGKEKNGTSIFHKRISFFKNKCYNLRQERLGLLRRIE